MIGKVKIFCNNSINQLNPLPTELKLVQKLQFQRFLQSVQTVSTIQRIKHENET